MYHFKTVVKTAIVFLTVLSAYSVSAQDYTTLAAGSWTTASNWNNSSGWGGTTPSITGGHSSGTATVNHNMAVAGNYSLASATLLINAGHTVTVTGNFSVGGGGNVNVYGTLEINGNVTLNSNLRIYPGGRVIVHGSLTVNSSDYLTVGTSTAPPPYADLIVYQNIVSNTSGDITVNRNGRVAVFGNVTAAGGGTLFTINNGGQVYVHGNINFSGGGSQIVNNNSTNPFGLYVNGTITNSGGGSSTTPNNADQATMINTNPGFSNWVQNIPGSPMPVELLFLKGELQDAMVLLTWATASEHNFDRFIIEHSVNGQLYKAVAEVAGSGFDTAERNEYSYTAEAPASRNYYRLKSVDKDGSFEYSQTILIERIVSQTIDVYPNPADDHVTIRINFEPRSTDLVQILDPAGNIVISVPVNSLEVEIPFAQNLRPGVYLLKFKGSTEKITRLLVR
ncbi:MAG: T9SS type A sorting domain-containing protein [Cyclobacteriaceae bacterium]|nr:T9SS type A sorting domain-containing protein [Cyclobacteriaceae bacterium]